MVEVHIYVVARYISPLRPLSHYMTLILNLIQLPWV
jgi:hypothetical protein